MFEGQLSKAGAIYSEPGRSTTKSSGCSSLAIAAAESAISPRPYQRLGWLENIRFDYADARAAIFASDNGRVRTSRQAGLVKR
jgi:hypothetical protein